VDRRGDALERAVPASERHGLGQYFTPQPLVDLLLSLAGRPARRSAVLLDPACGSGRFLLSARAAWGASLRLRGFETDPRALDAARAQLPGAAADLRPDDFLAAPARADCDLVAGNPPYVRNRAQDRDLYVDFVERSFDHLRPGGVLALVLSNAWLDVGYGRVVRDLLLRRAQVDWIVESTAERWFPRAAVHTMLLLARRCDDARERERQSVRFALVRRPLPARPEIVREVPQAALPLDAPWGPLLRASDLFLALRGDRGGLLDGPCAVHGGDAALPPPVALGALASLHRGLTTNDNAWFYPRNWREIQAGPAPVPPLLPVLKGARRIPGVRGSAATLPDRFRAEEKPGTAAPARPRGLRSAGAKRVPTLPPPARLFLLKGAFDRHRAPLLDSPLLYDQQLYGVLPAPGVDPFALAALLASSWGALSLEHCGRVNFGEGVLWLGLEDARLRLRLPDPRRAAPDALAALRAAWEALPDSPVPPAAAILDEPRSAWGVAWRALDLAAGTLFGAGPAEMERIRAEWCERARIRRAMAAGRPALH
jgi:predicted RNA methylase